MDSRDELFLTYSFRRLALHTDQLIPALNQAATMLGMLATWTPTKFDDQFVKVVQLNLKSVEVRDLLAMILDEHPDLLASPEFGAASPSSQPSSPVVLQGTIQSIITQPIKETHTALTETVKQRLESFGSGGQESGSASGTNVATIRAIAEREGVEWKSLLAYLPVLAQMILAILAKK